MKKTVFITGGTGGIGGAAARYFQSKDWNVILPVRNLPNADLQKLMLLPGISVSLCDVGKKDAVIRFLQTLKDDGVVIDLVFLAAGTFKWDDKFASENAAKEFLLDANYQTKVNVVEAITAVFSEHQKKISLYIVSSHAAHFAADSEYRTGKYKEEGYVYAMMHTSVYGSQLLQQGIFRAVHVLEPGLIDTPMAREEFAEERAGLIDWDMVPTPDEYINQELQNAA